MTSLNPLRTPLIALLLLLPAGARAERVVTLEQAYALALRNHPSIQLLRERVRQAEAARYKAWSALKPTFTFQGTYTHFDEEIVVDFSEMMKALGLNIPSEPTVLQKQDQFGFQAVANLPVFRGPAYPSIGLARKQVRLAELGEIRSRQDFLQQVARAYYMVVSQKEVVQALQNKVTVDLKHLGAAKARFEVGQAPRSTVLRADLVATQDQQQLRVQRNNLHVARRQLAILLGLSGSVEVKRPAEPATVKAQGGKMIDEALTVRRDYHASLLSVELAHQAKDTVWWGFAPSLDLTWLYRWTEAAGFATKKGMWNLMLTLNVPIYDGGIRYANLRESHAKLRQAEEQRRALAQEIEASIVKLRGDMDSAEAGVVSARKALELARTTASDMEVSFEAGAVTQLDVLDANQRLLDAELALTAQIFQRDLARLALTHALGKFDPEGGSK